MNLCLILTALLSSISAAVLIDLEGYYAARKDDPIVKFDWTLFLVRLFIGVLTGLAGLGVGSQFNGG